MKNFYEEQLKKMFATNSVLTNMVFCDKVAIGRIDNDLRAKIEFISTAISGQYNALKLSIINRKDGVVDCKVFKFYEVIGVKNNVSPHVWDSDGESRWYIYTPSMSELMSIATKVNDYIEVYLY